jgi:hypothetical protein
MSVLKAYCQECGMAHSYTLNKPNFCQACGVALGKGGKSPTTSTATVETEPPEFTSSTLQGLAFEHEPTPPSQLTIKDLISQNEAGVVPTHAPHETPKVSSEEVLAQLKKESSSLRGPQPQ